MASPRPLPPPTLRGPPRPHSMLPWVFVSGGFHVLVLLVGFGLMGRGVTLGAGVAQGSGFGGDSVELEIQGESDETPQGTVQPHEPTALAPSAPTEPAPLPTPDPTLAVDEAGAEAIARPELPERPRPEPPAAVARQEASVATDGLPSADEPGAAVAADEGALGETREAAGTDADDSTAGVTAGDEDARELILGSAGFGMGDAPSARRALLPNGGRCDDPVAGVWRSQKYRPSDRTWVRFILRVRRQGDALSGTITSRIWTGRPSNPNPGECTPFGFDHTWQMSARGRVDGERMTFESSRHRLIRQDCPSAQRTLYAPDNFRGTIDPVREIFDSTNNDGAFDINEPYLFRRVSCQ